MNGEQYTVCHIINGDISPEEGNRSKMIILKTKKEKLSCIVGAGVRTGKGAKVKKLPP